MHPVSLRRRAAAAAWLALAALCLPPWPAAHAERRPVLEQVDLPHPYYFRELYLPQLTEGPSAVAFAPDSSEVVYAMGGSLWRQKLDATVAVQLTDGPGYDYQPDWSPDGRHIAYVSYRDGALELRQLDLADGSSVALTQGGAVNVEPRYSPDGARLAFVSTAVHGHFHIFVAPVSAAGLGSVEQLTPEQRTAQPRYYYSEFDHEINPVWTRDGRSIVFVCNHGRVHGTGGFWQMEARPGAPAREIHYEETNWAAQPDFSPEGSRIVYSSYLGRNTHQLWTLPATGGADAFPLSYGDFDLRHPRWSPDGRWIAAISNETGATSLWLHNAHDGTGRRLEAVERRYLAAQGQLRVELQAADGSAGAARVSVVDGAGRFHAPRGAWIHADDGIDRSQRPFEAHYFHLAGSATLDVPAGTVTVEILRGFSQPLETRVLQVAAGGTVTLVARAQPWPRDALGGGHWESGDVHVHMNYGGNYRNTPAHLAQQAAAEDLGLVNALVVNKEQRFPDIAYGGHGLDPASLPGHLVLHGQEFHTSYWGHIGLLGLEGPTIVPGYAAYPNTAAASPAPMNAQIADVAHARGALVGYVHPFDDEPHPTNPAEALSHELPVDLALGKVDYLEILGFSDHRTTAGVWYRLLNLGFRLPAAGGTDAMANFASLRGPVGMNRTFVRVGDGPLDAAAWLAGLRAGHTFASNGPLLDFSLGGQPIGGQLRLDSARKLAFTARLHSIAPVDHFEVVCNGKVARTLALAGARTEADVAGTLELPDGGWCLLRAASEGAHHPVLDNYVYATTSPVYVVVKGRQARDPAQARYFMAWIDRAAERTQAYPDWNSPAEKAEVLHRLQEARAVYERLQ